MDRPVTTKPTGLEEDVRITRLPEEARVVTTAPVREPATPREWVRENLFSSPFNTLLTVVFGLFAAFLLFQVTKLVFFTGEWRVFEVNARSYMTGRWPLEELWRVWVAVYLVAVLAGAGVGVARLRPTWSLRKAVVGGALGLFALLVLVYAVDTMLVWSLLAGVVVAIAAGVVIGRAGGHRLMRPLLIAWLLAFPAVIIIFQAFDGVPPRLWGGFVLNITVAVVGIFVSFPIGVLLALGRRSSFPAIRMFCVGFIELIRGAPLYVLLITGAFLLPLLLPPQLELPLVIRAMLIYVIFSAAYVAEIVRGGLQGVHHGQYEASRALGLSVTKIMALVILPQALRSTIPTMISHFISLFKDTSLISLAGPFTDALRSARRASATLGEAGNSLEALLPAALMFWIVAYSMARWSQRLEERLGVGER